MKLAMICFSLLGAETGEQIKTAFEKQGVQVRFAKKSRYIPDAVPVNVDDWTREQFVWADGIVFIGACGIAVRHIAPYIRSKKTDPAVLCVDECGKFVISLLSGHLGGANELTYQVAEILGSIPVVTTATDLHGIFAVDVFARKNQCEIVNLKAAKMVSAALLAGKKVGFYSDYPWEGRLPEGLVLCDEREYREAEAPERMELGIAVTVSTACAPFPDTVVLIPKILTLGMGCRRGKEEKSIQEAALKAIGHAEVYKQAVGKLTSIDKKKDEPGLIALAQHWKIPFETYSEQKLRNVEGEFTHSSFVETVVGVDNVCERSAVLGSENGILIKKKSGSDGVTTALAVKDWRIHFE